MAAHRALDSETEVRPLASQQTKHCAGCGTTKSVDDFNRAAGRRDGLQVYCRTCQAAKAREYEASNPGRIERLAQLKADRRAVAQKYVQEYLQTHPCVDCSESDWVVLEFDHVRDKKKAHVMQLVADGYSLSAVDEEITKCDIRCANCHRRVTLSRGNWWRATAAD